jgi:hypothetical protein
MWHAGEAVARPLFNDDKTCEFMNTVHSSATPELEDFLGKQGIPWDVSRAARKPISEAHNRQETPLFAKINANDLLAFIKG